MEYVTFALPLALLLTWLGWQMWDRRRFRECRETEWRRLEELNERKLRDQRLIELQIRSSGLKDLTPGQSTGGLPQGLGQNISEPNVSATSLESDRLSRLTLISSSSDLTTSGSIGGWPLQSLSMNPRPADTPAAETPTGSAHAAPSTDTKRGKRESKL